MAQTSAPEKTPSLPSRDLQRRHVQLALQTPLHFGSVGALNEKLHRLSKVGRRVFDRVALARDLELRTERNESVAFAVNHRCESAYIAHRRLRSLRRHSQLPQHINFRADHDVVLEPQEVGELADEVVLV